MLFKVNNKGSKCFMNASVLACFIELNTFLSMLNKKTFIAQYFVDIDRWGGVEVSFSLIVQ